MLQHDDDDDDRGCSGIDVVTDCESLYDQSLDHDKQQVMLFPDHQKYYLDWPRTWTSSNRYSDVEHVVKDLMLLLLRLLLIYLVEWKIFVCAAYMSGNLRLLNRLGCLGIDVGWNNPYW